MSKRAISTMSGPDGLVHWKGFPHGIPQEIASGIRDYVIVNQQYGISRLKKVINRPSYRLSTNGLCLQKSGTTLSLTNLIAIFQEEFGKSEEEATSLATSLFLQLNTGMVAKH